MGLYRVQLPPSDYCYTSTIIILYPDLFNLYFYTSQTILISAILFIYISSKHCMWVDIKLQQNIMKVLKLVNFRTEVILL